MEKFVEEDNEILKFRDNVDFARTLDEKFHTIIDPDNYGIHNYYKILNYYWLVIFIQIKL